MTTMIHELVTSEIRDFFAGLGNPGEPDTPEEMQRQLLARILPVLTPADSEPVTGAASSRLSFSRDLPISVTVHGEEWRLFPVNFVHDSRIFSFYIHATSRLHASVMVADIRESAVLDENDLLAFSDTPPDENTLAELELLSGAVVQ